MVLWDWHVDIRAAYLCLLEKKSIETNFNNPGFIQIHSKQCTSTHKEAAMSPSVRAALDGCDHIIVLCAWANRTSCWEMTESVSSSVAAMLGSSEQGLPAGVSSSNIAASSYQQMAATGRHAVTIATMSLSNLSSRWVLPFLYLCILHR